MTWFRVGGAGIPATLKNAMNAVFNKKFGTSGQNYPPKQWPDDVNLMGPLPEGIATGPVANFSDGADRVPTKNVIVTLPASLSGVSTITETQTGKNLIDLSSLVDGYVNTNGTFNTNHSNGEMRSGFIPVKPNTTYYFSIVETTGTAADWVGIGEYTNDDVTAFIRRDSFWRFTTSATAKYVVVSSRNLAQATKIQLEIGNDPTTWEAYTPITQYTASLGRTIYGGTADLVTGEGVDGYGRIIFDGSNDEVWQKHGSIASWFYIDNAITDGYVNSAENDFMICNLGTQAKYASVAQLSNGQFAFGLPSPTTYRFVFKNTDFTEIADFREWLSNNNMQVVYKLATPTDFTFDGQEINSLYGANNFWNDAGGDTTVVYRRDIDLALQSVSSSRGLMMASRPVTQLIGEESDPDQVNELVENDETEQEGEDNAR